MNVAPGGEVGSAVVMLLTVAEGRADCIFWPEPDGDCVWAVTGAEYDVVSADGLGRFTELFAGIVGLVHELVLVTWLM